MKRRDTESVFKKVGKYELLKEIGQGSFARVYKARAVDEEGYFAVKMI
jgi:serine/threonine protein kinase